MKNNNVEPLSYIFHEIYKLFINNVKSEASLVGINPTYRYIFFCLKCHNEGLTQSKLCELTHLKAPSISLLLQQMEKDELIIREKSLDDNRKTIVRLSDKGIALDNKLKNIFRKHENILESSLQKEEKENLKKYLSKIINNLKGVENHV